MVFYLSIVHGACRWSADLLVTSLNRESYICFPKPSRCQWHFPCSLTRNITPHSVKNLVEDDSILFVVCLSVSYGSCGSLWFCAQGRRRKSRPSQCAIWYNREEEVQLDGWYATYSLTPELPKMDNSLLSPCSLFISVVGFGGGKYKKCSRVDLVWNTMLPLKRNLRIFLPTMEKWDNVDYKHLQPTVNPHTFGWHLVNSIDQYSLAYQQTFGNVPHLMTHTQLYYLYSTNSQ